MVLPQYKNNATTELDEVHNSGSSTLTVVDASVFPILGVGETFFVTIWNSILYSRTEDDADMETVEVNDVTGNVLTLVSPTVNDHVSGAGVDNMLTEDFFNALETDIAAIEGDVSQNANDISTNASDISTHVADTENPHSTTKDQVGLSNVTNDAQLRADQLETATVTDDDAKVPSLGLMYDEKAAMQAEIDSDIATHTAIADAHHTNANDPTTDQKNALTGSHGTPSASNLYLTEDGIGVANGVAELDSGGKVPVAQLPDYVVGAVKYQGTWDADTNTPTLTTTPPEKGWYYKVSVAGTFETVDYEVGDWIISNGTAWEKVDNTDQVTSVFGRQGAVVAQSGDYNASQITDFQTTVSANTDVAASKSVTDLITITQAVDLDAIESKVDGIEALADVTDSDNVAAAGAVMESGGTISGDIAFDGTINISSGIHMYWGGTNYIYGSNFGNMKYNAYGDHVFLHNTFSRFTIGSSLLTYVPLDMNSHQINNVTNPTSDQDAATKNYVDELNRYGNLKNVKELLLPPNDSFVLVEYQGEVYKAKIGNIRRE